MSKIKNNKDSKDELLQIEINEEGKPELNGKVFKEKLVDLLGLPGGLSDKVLVEFISSHIEPLLDSSVGVNNVEDNQEALENSFAKMNLVLAQLQEMQPNDQVEMMLSLQLIGLNNAFMKTMTLTKGGKVPVDKYERYLNLMNKLGRTVNKTVTALNKQRNKGRQNVTVKHVHVHEGGQAAIGSFEKEGGGL